MREDPNLKDGLPVARLKPRDAAEQLVVLRGKASEGARSVGRFAAVTTKLVAMIGVCGLGLYLVGAGSSRMRSSYDHDFDRRMESINRMNESLRAMQQMQHIRIPTERYLPKVDHRDYYDRNTRPSLQRDTPDTPAVMQSKKPVKKKSYVAPKQRP